MRDGSDVTIVALKLAMSLHLPLPKIRTIGDEFTLSLAKNSHFSFVPSHFPTLSNGASRATSDRKPKTNDQILPSPILFFPSKN